MMTIERTATLYRRADAILCLIVYLLPIAWLGWDATRAPRLADTARPIPSADALGDSRSPQAINAYSGIAVRRLYSLGRSIASRLL